MKLWHVAQWGNREEGGNGWDTQCIVRANDLPSALTIAELHFDQFDHGWRDGKADVVYLMGDDGSVGDEPKLIVPIWIKPAFNLGRYPSWHFDLESKEWKDSKTMYGEE